VSLSQDVLVTRDAQLSAEPCLWFSHVILVGGWWCTCVTFLFHMGPLTMGWATCCTSCAPWPDKKGWVLICSMSICMGYSLQQHPCCPQLGCGGSPSSDVGEWSPTAGAMVEEVILPLQGGGLRQFNAFR
jgi:hypothetical protein